MTFLLPSSSWLRKLPIDAAVPGDFKVVEKENNKIVKYQELVVAMHTVQHTRTWVILTVIINQGAEYLLTDYLALLRVKKQRVDSIQ